MYKTAKFKRNLKENSIYMQTDPDEQLADSTHKFHKLNEKLYLNTKNDFNILHSNICSLQSNVDDIQILTDNVDFQFDVCFSSH